MDEKLEKLADNLVKRADEYKEIFSGNHREFFSTSSYSIAMALREVAMEIRKVNND